MLQQLIGFIAGLLLSLVPGLQSTSPVASAAPFAQAAAAAKALAFPCSRLILDTTDQTIPDKVFSFTSSTSVSNFFGSTNIKTKLANSYFVPNNNICPSAVLSFIRFPILPARAHIYGGNLENTQLSGSGVVSITSQGYSWNSAVIELTNNFTQAAAELQNGINGVNNSNLPVVASTTNSTLTPANCTFSGYPYYVSLNVTANQSCNAGPPIGSVLCDVNSELCIDGSYSGSILTNQENLVMQKAYENNNTTLNVAQTPNVETYTMFLRTGTGINPKPIPITAYWEVLTVGSVLNGTVAAGQQLIDSNSLGTTTCVIASELSNGQSNQNGSTWLVSCPMATVTNHIGPEEINMTPCSIHVVPTVPSASRSYFNVSQNGYCPYYTSSIGYINDVNSTIAHELQVSENSSAFSDSEGKVVTNIAQEMSYILSLDNQWSTVQLVTNPLSPTSKTNYAGGPATIYGVAPALKSWSNTTNGKYYYFEDYGATTPPAGTDD